MIAGVFTPYLRIEFVDGQESATPDPGFVACGDGTGFPMELTGATVADKLDKVAEICYRVKDAEFTGGQFEITTIYGGPVYYVPPSLYDANKTKEDGDCLTSRGYSYAGTDSYNQTGYTVGGITYSDIDDNERGMWRSIWNTDRTIISYTHPFTDAFTFASNTPTGYSDYGWKESGNNYGLSAESIRGMRVAVVKANPADGFFESTNKFYLEFEFTWLDYPTSGPVFGGGTNTYNGVEGYGDWSAVALVMCNYIIRLSSGDISCSIYIADYFSEITAASGSDIIHAATEWWPYAQGAPSTDVWNTATGARL